MGLSLKIIEPYYKDPRNAEKDFEKLAAFSAEDRKLLSWLGGHEEIWEVLPPIFEKRIGTRQAFDRWLKEAAKQHYTLSAAQRSAGAFLLLLELREYAGHSLHNVFREPPHYEQMLRNVHKRVAKRLDKEWNEADAVSEQERMLTELLVGESLANLSADELKKILQESGFDAPSDFSQIKNSFSQMMVGNSLKSIESIVGKGFTRATVFKIIEGGLKKKAFGFGAKQIGKRLLTKLPGTLGKRLGLYVGLGFLVKDAYDMGSEATRITNPAVISIALFRTLSE